MLNLKLIFLALALGASGLHAQTAQVQPVLVEGAWVRPAVQGQPGTGAYMTLTAPADSQLIGVSSPVAGVAEVHEMKMDGDVMRMRALPSLRLPAGRPVQLKPGSYHVMLMQLKAPLAQGSKVPLTLSFKDAKGVTSTLALEVPVTNQAPGAASKPAAGEQGHHHAPQSHDSHSKGHQH